MRRALCIERVWQECREARRFSRPMPRRVRAGAARALGRRRAAAQVRGKAEVREELLDHGRVGDEGDEHAVAAAVRALLQVFLVDAFDELCPADPG